MAFNPEGKEI